MSKFEDENYKERLLKYIFEYTWLEPPLFRYNEGKILYFDVESKPETQTAQLIKSVFDDVFFIGSKLFVVFYCYTDPMFRKLRCDWKDGKKYFKRFSLKKILRKRYKSKNEDNDENNYIVVCLTERSSFKFKEFLTDYLEDEQNCQMAFLSLKKGTAIQLPDSRGFNLVSTDQDFLSFLHKKHEKVCVRE